MVEHTTVYFATNRRPTINKNDKIIGFGSDPGPIDGTAVRFGSIEVDKIAGEWRARESSLWVADEILYAKTGQVAKRGSKEVFDYIRKEMMAKNRPTLVAIHGFGNSFIDAMERAATIKAFYGVDANVFAFTWPSRGSPVGIPIPYADYVHDRETARISGTAMARTLRILHRYIDGLPLKDRCRQKIHLICHSMGNYALRHGVQALLRMPPDEPATSSPEGRPLMVAIPTETGPNPDYLRRTFDQIVLAAADEDDDAFDDPEELKYLPRLGAAVTVYHTGEDWILSTLSQVTKFNGPRLGMHGPDNMMTISDKISAVDVGAVTTVLKEFQNHQYYRIIPEVRDDIVQVLTGTLPHLVEGREFLGSRRYRIGADG